MKKLIFMKVIIAGALVPLLFPISEPTNIELTELEPIITKERTREIVMIKSKHKKEENMDNLMKYMNKHVNFNQAQKIVESVIKYSDHYRLEPEFVLAVIKVESRFNHRARNETGATGLMQIIPRWHPEKLKNKNLLRVEDNIAVGCRILREYLDKFKGNKTRALKFYSGDKSMGYVNKVNRALNQIIRA